MSDQAAILAAFDHACVNDLPAVLATVVGASGSTYRKPGARMILVGDGTRVGVVSGGCLEADVARRAWFLKSSGEAELVRYDTGIGDDATYEFGLGCRGMVEVLLERLDTRREPQIISLLRAAVEERRTSSVSLFIRGPRIGERSERETVEGDKAVCEVIVPPVQLVIFGSGVDVVPLVRIARAVGWRSIVIDHRFARERTVEAELVVAADAARWTDHLNLDDRTAAVLMTHRMDDDAAYLASLVGTPIGYVGCLGPASRTEALLDQLALDGVTLDPAVRARLHAPVGLALGGERPEEIALAIVAEIQATLNHATAIPLRDRPGPIHIRTSSVAGFATDRR